MVGWPGSRWLGLLILLRRTIWFLSLWPTAIVLVAAYLAVAALVWAFADATMPPLRDIGEFPPVRTAPACGVSLTCPIFMS